MESLDLLCVGAFILIATGALLYVALKGSLVIGQAALDEIERGKRESGD